MNALVIIPTYNEALNLSAILQRLFAAAPAVTVLVVDDNSPDGTGELAEKLAKSDERIFVLHREAKQGLGPAYLAGFAWALARDYDAIVEMDADGSHRPEQLPKLLARFLGPDHPDLVIGSRWVAGGQVVGWPFRREILSRGANAYIWLLLRLPARDATAGFRLYRADFLSKLKLQEVDSAGYGFQIDMTWRIDRAGGKIVEVPITFDQRKCGTSKMSGGIISEALVQVWRWFWQERFSAKTST